MEGRRTRDRDCPGGWIISIVPRRDACFVTCEHGGNRIPAPFRAWFRDWQSVLATHRGYDLGALPMARALATALGASIEISTVSRLLVDLNRSPGHPGLFSSAIRAAPAAVRRDIMAGHYQPYRERVGRVVDKLAGCGRRVVHISSHSFTPELDGRMRNADIGLLYDPARPGEVRLAARWQAALAALAPDYLVRRNYPYRGTGDGVTRHLRSCHPPTAYVGIELEINQRIFRQPAAQQTRQRALVIAALRQALAPSPTGAP